jgi:hypothetical protein
MAVSITVMSIIPDLQVMQKEGTQSLTAMQGKKLFTRAEGNTVSNCDVNQGKMTGDSN